MGPTASVEASAHRRRPMIRVLVVDDHAPLRRLVVDVLGPARGITVVGECHDGGEVVDAVRRTRPHVVLMDARMPGTSGLDATRRVLAVAPQVRVLLLTGAHDEDRSPEARRLGAVGWMSKRDVADLPETIRHLARGGTAWAPAPREASDQGTA